MQVVSRVVPCSVRLSKAEPRLHRLKTTGFDREVGSGSRHLRILLHGLERAATLKPHPHPKRPLTQGSKHKHSHWPSNLSRIDESRATCLSSVLFRRTTKKIQTEIRVNECSEGRTDRSKSDAEDFNDTSREFFENAGDRLLGKRQEIPRLSELRAS